MNNIEILKLLEERIALARGQKEFYIDRVDSFDKEERQYNREQYFKYCGILDELLQIQKFVSNKILKNIKENLKNE